jgi:site-specific DNA-cytosine methylase
MPATHSLQDVGKYYLERVGPEKKDKLLRAARAAAKEGRPLKVGTMCSGTDSPVAVLKGLAKALGGKFPIEHTFSCEFDGKKREWIKDNFPSLKMLFGDVLDLRTGTAFNYITNQDTSVPKVDIVIAGFVCKSVSSENNDREKFANCIKEAIGKTGETFDGVMGYVTKYRPRIVVCENVTGLVKKNRGAEPVIEHVKASFNKVGYAFAHRVLDSRNYLLPQRRNRCWMWAFDGTQHQEAVESTGEDVVALASSKGFTLDQLFKLAKVTGTSSKVLNARKKRVLAVIMRKVKPADRTKEIVLDVAKSESRVPHCIGATTCIVPNSQPYRVRTQSILTAEQMHCVQGIYKEDFPALAKYAKEKTVLACDLAGNAFSTTVCMAVMISCLVHAPESKLLREPTTPTRKRCRSPASPPKGKRMKVGESPASKYVKGKA